MRDGYAPGLHQPRVGCWGCVLAFAESVDHWADEDGHCPHPGGAELLKAFRAWAEDLQIAHGPHGAFRDEHGGVVRPVS